MTTIEASVTHYRYAVQWSAEDEEFVATVAEFPSLSWLADDQISALTGLEELVQSIISDMRNSGEEVPEPLATRTFSGRLNLRVTPELHRRIALEALELGKSINKHASDRLAAG